MPKIVYMPSDSEIPVFSSISSLLRLLWKLNINAAGELWDVDGTEFMRRTFERRVRKKNQETNSTQAQQST